MLLENPATSPINDAVNVDGEKIDIKLTCSNSLELGQEHLVAFERVTSRELADAQVDISAFLLPEDTLELVDEAEREDAFYSFCMAQTKLFHRLMEFTGCTMTQAEFDMLNEVSIANISTQTLNDVIKINLPMILSRLARINEWSPRAVRTLNITQIGEYIQLQSPWVIPFADPGLIIDIEAYPQHTAKLREDGMLTYYTLTDVEGNEFYTANDEAFALEDGSVEYPYVHGIPAFSESDVWLCLNS